MPTPSATTPASTTLLPGAAPIGVILEADPTAWDAANTPLVLVDNTNTWLIAEDLPAPDEDPLWTSNRDMDGEALVHTRHRNRKCTWKIRVHGDDAVDVQERALAIEKKVDKLRREGGTIQRTLPSNHAYFLEVVAGTSQCAFDRRWVNTAKLDVTLELTARPYWHGGWANVGTVTETTLPAAIFDTDQIPGSVAALGRLVVENTGSADQAFLMWGLQSKTYDDAASAALFYEAEDLTNLGDAADAVMSGASGGDVVSSGDLPANVWLGILSTGTLTHVGDYRVWARVRVENVASTDLALEWGTGDFRAFVRNDAKTCSTSEASWVLVDLGLVHVPADEAQWEGRIVARCVQAETSPVHIDCLFMMPVTEGYGEVSGVDRVPTATALAALDGFTQTAGNLTGKALDIGGTWAGDGDPDDFTIDTSNDLARRTTTGDSTPGRFEYVSGLDVAGVVVAATVSGVNAVSGTAGITARYVDDANHVRAQVVPGFPAFRLNVLVGGTETLLDTASMAPYTSDPATEDWRIELTVSPYGNVTAVFRAVSNDVEATLSGFASDLAPSGSLSSGSVGIYDNHFSLTAATRTWGDFYAYEVPSDPAIFATQNLEVLHDRVVREHSTGSLLTRVSRYAGDYLLVPCSAGEERAARVIVKTSRGNPADQAADSGIDDITATLYVKPRFIHLPE